MGALVILMPWQLLIAFGLAGIIGAFTRNPVLSINISLLSVPISAWFLEKSLLLVAFSLVLLVIMVAHFLPTARAALVRAGSRDNLVAELLRRDKDKGR